MLQKISATAHILLLVLHSCLALPFNAQSNDIEDNFMHTNQASTGRAVDYHTVVGHFKDFLMYLPVMMTTFKETMSGFPKFAEGWRILTSPQRYDPNCKCKGGGDSSDAASNEIENNSRYR